ncbi:uncharacterized protein LOC124172832 [Ischnura elegans]|uniref:uncharacterized protein LOC124172832 n=1 Tax=Ischnura elegans TaxID=197161 RepID=UPI001ED873AF|nr:uncharacterized protein LOC124172832 [Ischnura elegans]
MSAKVGDKDPELDIGEQLFCGVFSGPLEQYEDLLEALDDVNVSLKQRTLLHIAVKLGKIDWVEGLLGRGADPTLPDGESITSLELSEDMKSKHPNDKDRLVINKMVKLVHRRESTGRTTPSDSNRTSTGDLSIFGVQNKEPDYHETKKLYPEFSQEMMALKDAISKLTVLFSSEFLTINKSVDSLIAEMSNHQQKMTLITEAMCNFRKDLASRDLLLESIGGSMGSLGDDLAPSKDSKCSSVILDDSSDNQLDVSIRSEERMMQDVINGMMNRTHILNPDKKKVQLVRGFYEKLYNVSDLTCCLLKYVKSQTTITILVDCDSINIGRMKKTFKDHDGVERKGMSTFSCCDFKEMKVYLGGKVDALYRKEHVTGWLAKSLAELSMYMMYGNNGEPYAKDDEFHGAVYEKIVAEAEERCHKRLSLDSYIFCALRYNKTQVAKRIELIAAVPRIIAYYGGSEGIHRLNHQLPNLIDFYEHHVMTSLLSKA